MTVGYFVRGTGFDLSPTVEIMTTCKTRAWVQMQSPPSPCLPQHRRRLHLGCFWPPSSSQRFAFEPRVWKEEEVRTPYSHSAREDGTATVLSVGRTSGWRDLDGPCRCGGSLAGQGGPGCPGLDSRGKHRMFFSRDWSTAGMGHWDNACQVAKWLGRKIPAISSQPGLWHRGTACVKGDWCLSNERMNSFMFDFGDVRLDPRSLHQSWSWPWAPQEVRKKLS